MVGTERRGPQGSGPSSVVSWFLWKQLLLNFYLQGAWRLINPVIETGFGDWGGVLLGKGGDTALAEDSSLVPSSHSKNFVNICNSGSTYLTFSSVLHKDIPKHRPRHTVKF